MAKLINLTGHDVVVVDDAGAEILRLPPSGIVARVSVSQEIVGTLNGVPMVTTVFGKLTGLPEPQVDTVYVTSTLVAQYAAQEGRKDVVSPDTGPTAVREGGQVKAVRRFQVFWA